jgi:hypothetical protein
MSKAHNLDVNMYSLTELLGLFDLTYDLDIEGIKRAKKKVLMTHPDKSKLPSEYFLFYKKAFEMVYGLYEEQSRQNRRVPSEPVEYTPVAGSVKKGSVIKSEGFNQKFNEIFEKTMVVAPDPTRNEWFKSETALYADIADKNINRAFETIKSQQTGVVRYRGVETMKSAGGTNLYDDDTDDSYVTCDPFSKLKYDDLRKVHKDQTILAVGDSDYEKIQKYNSMDHLVQARGRQQLSPLDKTEAERIVADRHKEQEHIIMQKQHAANLKSMAYEKKNKQVLGHFLRLT